MEKLSYLGGLRSAAGQSHVWESIGEMPAFLSVDNAIHAKHSKLSIVLNLVLGPDAYMRFGFQWEMQNNVTPRCPPS